MKPIPVAADLFATLPELRLIGGRHRETHRLVFPLPANPAYEATLLPQRGLLWSYTIQRFAPKSPPYRGGAAFAPFAVGYVELPDALIVESPLVGAPFETLRVGMPMALTTLEWQEPAGGVIRQTYAFTPFPAATGAS